MVIAYLYSDPLLEESSELVFSEYNVDRIYQDFTTQRTQLQQLIDDHQNEPVQLLIRQVEDLGESIAEIQNRLAQLETLNIELITLESETLSATTLEQLQNLQYNQRSRKIRQGHAQNRVKTLAPPGKAPYGYRRSRNRYILDRTTAPVVKEFFDRFLLYGSLRDAVRFLEKKYGKKISVSTGQRWLTSPVYRGDLEYQTGETIPDTHPAILSRDEAAQIDRLLRRNRRLPARTASAPRSLAGLVTCGECQSGMTVTRVTSRKKGQKEYLYLRPMQCPKQCKAIAYDDILQSTIERICEDLPRAVSEAGIPDLDAIKQRINSAIVQKQSILEQIPPLIETGILDSETADLRSYKLRSEIAQLQAQLSQLPPVNLKAIAQTVSIPQFWLDLSEAERRFYFREFIRQIELIRTETGWQLKLNFIF
ncbi:recombinase [Leptolyngbya boryana NIES-2135]|jgi:DNA invertase Pin-like site-specific DNA recombinase|uniref:Recombinase n=1 Tax=Leptolyngbya boryana NIES-2135 TaxID=1973484 RepID=A0A1Z4J9E0_LEPBY|nr:MULTISPECIES: recombinase family protein [Leptolyngbya]BAY53360.1 recombinase [Leptolyngbya boryana NIES-2135]MBD2366775.1 recombinase family protein [Leptolyngbya sp. FACHB-161]MBD2373210.1 recombinase family protein [Leptolyngbya sp. FACHB-238]MBD2397611.1 recombinase family protein [Leptolyngbya sp. FACHB-239]MBD2404755.1 recombinase family protein [Leptolyngbya sp. FACHB-402]